MNSTPPIFYISFPQRGINVDGIDRQSVKMPLFFLENINISKLNMTKENKILVQMKLCIQKDTYLLHMHLRLNKISLTLLQCWRGREGQLLFLERFFISFFYNKKFALAKNSVFGHFRSYKLVNSI